MAPADSRWRACALTVALAGCRGEPAAPVNAPAARLELELRAPDASAPAWGSALELVEDAGAARGWRGRYPVRGGGELGLELVSERPAAVLVRAAVGAFELGRAALEFDARGGQWVRFDIPQDQDGEIAVFLEGTPDGAVRLASARIAVAPPAGLLEAQGGRADAVLPLHFLGETREARLLRPGWRAVARARMPAAGARLALAFAPLANAPGLALVCQARSQSEHTCESRIEMPRGVRWNERELALPFAAGEAFELSLELDGEREAGQPVALATPVLYAPQREPATVLLVTSDTHRGDHLEGAERAAALQTPTLRALAARGVFFSDAYATSNITVPSHVALLTGFDPRDSGVTDNRSGLSDEPVTLAECFQREGWRTLAVTSVSLLAPSQSNVGQGFDAALWTAQTRAADKTVELALRALEAAPERPTFMWVHLFDAHGPYRPPEPFDRAFYPQGRDPRDPSLVPEPGLRVPPYLPGVRDAEYVRALYRGEIGFLDAELARLLEHPRVRAGTVALTGDHGEELGTHGIWWAHKDLYPDTLHVPLILAWPGAPAGSHVDAPVRNPDVGRTLLDLAGLRGVAFPGRNLVAGGLPRAAPRFALGGGRAEASLNVDGWHLILQLEPVDDESSVRGRERHELALFRLSEDPQCREELSAREPERAAALRAQLVEWLAGWRGERLVGKRWDDARSRAALAALGYASDAGGGASEAALIDPRCACEHCVRWR